MFAPANTPREVVAKIYDDIHAILPQADVRTRLSNMGPVPASSTPEEFTALVRSEVARWSDVVKKSGAQVD